MRYQPLPPEFYAANRAAFATNMEEGAMAILDTAGALSRSKDFELSFQPDPNFFYLTGLDQPGAVLVILAGQSGSDHRELLFIRESTDFSAQWEGERYTPKSAAKLSGVTQVLWLSELEDILERLALAHETIYTNAEPTLHPDQITPARRRLAQLKTGFGLHQFRSAIPLIHRQRLIKDPLEVEQIRRAIDLTHQGLRAAWRVLRPGIREYALEAEIIAAFMRKGARVSFPSIIASGQAATIMHYMANDAEVGKTDVVLFDIGAAVGHYSADISRAVPANGRFTARQRAIHEAVRRTQAAGIALHKPGTTIREIDSYMREVLVEELKALKLPSATTDDIYPHISHQLGLDVHDSPSVREVLRPGMVVTCEPGLYLREEGIGVRLEDDILITDDGCEVLSAAIPSDPDELEQVFQELRA